MNYIYFSDLLANTTSVMEILTSVNVNDFQVLWLNSENIVNDNLF